MKIGIFALGYDNNTWYTGERQIGKVYSVSIREDGSLVRDYYPTVGDNSKFCLYDMETHEYYYDVNGNDFGGSYL